MRIAIITENFLPKLDGVLDNQPDISEAQLVEYRACLSRLVENEQERAQYSAQALADASQRSWYEGMQSVVEGYNEVIEEQASTLVAA